MRLSASKFFMLIVSSKVAIHSLAALRCFAHRRRPRVRDRFRSWPLLDLFALLERAFPLRRDLDVDHLARGAPPRLRLGDARAATEAAAVEAAAVKAFRGLGGAASALAAADAAGMGLTLVELSSVPCSASALLLPLPGATADPLLASPAFKSLGSFARSRLFISSWSCLSFPVLGAAASLLSSAWSCFALPCVGACESSLS